MVICQIASGHESELHMVGERLGNPSMRALAFLCGTGFLLLLAACASLLPEQPQALQWEAARECESRFQDIRVMEIDASGHLSPSAPAAGRTSVPIKIVGNTMVVSVTINSSQQAFLLVDTGSVKTILSPALMDRLRIAIPLNAPRWTVRLVGGATAAMPFVRVQSVQVGRLTVEELDVGVYNVFPTGAGVEGLLGADFLNHFRITIDRTAGRLTLVVIQPNASPSAAPGEEAR
jgi:hypothetical protein